MQHKINNHKPSFQARLKVSYDLPADLGALIKIHKNVLPDNYLIKVKSNWKIPILGENYEKKDIPFEFNENFRGIKGNLEVSVEEGKIFGKKSFIDKSIFNWFKDKHSNKNSFMETASNIFKYLEEVKQKIALKSN